MIPLFNQLPRRPENAFDAHDALVGVAGRLRDARSPYAAFPAAYAVVVGRVRDALEEGVFLEPAWVNVLAAKLVTRYLDTLARAVEGQPQDTAGWGRVYQRGVLGTSLPLRNAALAGAAHLFGDLAPALVDAVVTADLSPARVQRARRDLDTVAELAHSAFGEVIAALREQRCWASEALVAVAPQLARRLVDHQIRAWMARAWADAEVMLGLKSAEARAVALHLVQMRARLVLAVLDRLGGHGQGQ